VGCGLESGTWPSSELLLGSVTMRRRSYRAVLVRPAPGKRPAAGEPGLRGWPRTRKVFASALAQRLRRC